MALTARMASTTQPQALDNGGDGTWVSPGAFLFTPRMPPYEWGGWLWANMEDGAAWWEVARQGPYDKQAHLCWWWGRVYFVVSCAFLVALGIIKGIETGFLLKTTIGFTLVQCIIYGEFCWEMLWIDRCIALSTGIFTYRSPLLQEGESQTDDEGDEEQTGHAKTE